MMGGAIMKAIEIKPGILVVADGRLGKVVRCLADAKVEVLLRGANSTKKYNVDNVECVDPDYDPELPIAEGDVIRGSMDDKEVELADSRFNIITNYLDKKVSRTEACDALGASNGLFYKLLERYDREIGPISLTRLPRGRQSGTLLIDPVRENLIAKAIKLNWNGRAASVASIWRKLNELCAEEGLVTPSKKTIKARMKLLPEKERYAHKYGSEAADQKFGARPGALITTCPLEWVQMDHTQVDLIVVSEIERKPLGRPWLTILIDVHTRIILGYYLSLHYPSTVSVSCAVTHAVLPKGNFLERLRRSELSYPFYGVPKNLHMDNAKEFKTSGFQSACGRNGIKPNWRPYGRKHYGGHVERLIGTMMTAHVHFLPGTTMSNVAERKGIDSEKTSALTFGEFSRWFLGEVALYHKTKHAALEGSPAQEWNKFFIENAKTPRHPALVSDPHKFRLDFMPEKRRSIRNIGVMLFSLKYWSPVLYLYVGHKNVPIKYDPFTLKTVWAFLNNEYVPLTFSDPTQEDVTLNELRLKNKGRANGTLDSTELISVIRENEDIVKASVKETKRARMKAASVSTYLQNQAIETSPAERPPKSEKPDYSKKAAPFSREPK
jgi:putative transposase